MTGSADTSPRHASRPGAGAAMSCAPDSRSRDGPDPAAATSIVVVGASAGGVEALIVLAGALPADLPAAVLVVLHVAPAGTSLLHQILGRFCALPVAQARDGEILRGGSVVVAPADRHLLVDGDAIRLDAGAKEHHHRPAVDPAMRSAALARGPAAIGIVLSGTRADGTAGLAAIKAHGGLAVAQDPSEALHGGMPRSAIDAVRLDAVLPVAAMAPWLVRRLQRLPARPGFRPAA